MTMEDEHLKETTIHTDRIFDGRIIQVDHSTVQLPDGSESKREIVYHNGAVSVIAVHRGLMYFVRQYRVAPDEVLFEIPAGKIEKGDIPHDAAVRELEEEIGATAGNIEQLFEFYVSPGFSNELVSLYEAKNIRLKDQKLDEDEFLDIEKVPLDRLHSLLMNGTIRDAKTIIAVQYVLSKYNLE
ncbi:NUDIX hydrolase [Salinicoccus albus]|uniref:NUDIX hydrolase n=1 Tax=Salinicoccus albus TaxID=418756 RepID=UPI000363A3C6|nr:NUDIX hydrolase [Salinicoccus albus]